MSFEPSLTVLSPQPLELEAPDLSLDAILRRFPGLAAAEAACITGSTARGWGNTFSDVDMYAFADRELELPMDESAEAFAGSDRNGLTWTRWIGTYGDGRVDLTVWPAHAFETVLAPFLASPEPEFMWAGETIEEFVYRSSIGRPLVNEPFFERLREQLDASAYRRALTRSLKAAAENALMDVAGQLRTGDEASARLSAIESAGSVADACLVAAGDICRGGKWLLRRLEETPECGITPEDYTHEVLDGPHPGESPGRYALRVARWTQSHAFRLEEFTLVMT